MSTYIADESGQRRLDESRQLGMGKTKSFVGLYSVSALSLLSAHKRRCGLLHIGAEWCGRVIWSTDPNWRSKVRPCQSGVWPSPRVSWPIALCILEPGIFVWFAAARRPIRGCRLIDIVNLQVATLSGNPAEGSGGRASTGVALTRVA